MTKVPDSDEPSGLMVGELTREDVDDIAGFWVRLVEEHHRIDPRYRLGEDGPERYRMFLLESILRPDMAVFVARDAGQAVGYIAGRLMGPAVIYDERLEGVVQDAYVAPGHRNRGIGSRLLVRLLAHFREKGATNVLLDVSALNPDAERFWRRYGFGEFRHTLWISLGGEERNGGGGQ